MINILSYIGMTAQSEVCLWTLLGLLRTIFDATLFKVNANLKQVWQMSMPPELSLPVQRVLRTMISGVMLVQCFTVYVYLASYIVLLYPVFLEERPTLVLPWLLLAAIRNFLCELTSLALGLGTCVLLGPARPPCIKFLITKISSIMPSVYMWMLIFSYYHNLKLASAFKTFPAVSPANNLDYGLELAVRRRRTKSLQGEDQLRKKLIASLYHENLVTTNEMIAPNLPTIHENAIKSETSSTENVKAGLDGVYPFPATGNRTLSDIGTYEDWFGNEVILPRDTDRILEQFVLMLLRIGAFLNKDDADLRKLLSSTSQAFLTPKGKRPECTTIPTEDTDTNPIVGNSKGRMASYLIDYPDIFMRKPSDILGPHTLNEHKRHDTHLLDISSLSSVSTREVSLNTTSLRSQNKGFQQVSGKQMIHSDEDVTDPVINEEIKHIEHLHGSSLDTTQPAEITSSSDNIKDIINRMIARAAIPLEEQRNETSPGITEPSSERELPMSSSQKKKNVNIKKKSKESLLNKKRKERKDK